LLELVLPFICNTIRKDWETRDCRSSHNILDDKNSKATEREKMGWRRGLAHGRRGIFYCKRREVFKTI